MFCGGGKCSILVFRFSEEFGTYFSGFLMTVIAGHYYFPFRFVVEMEGVGTILFRPLVDKCFAGRFRMRGVVGRCRTGTTGRGGDERLTMPVN